jgi:Na+-translocating ferredoxin:NAD+ oxidoreductase RNF subunit RnfB
LERTAKEVQSLSMCGLGRTAPNPILSAITHFRDEFEAHLQGRCPAGKCKALIQYSVGDLCIGCTRCVQTCPVDAIPFTPHEKHTIDNERCTRCDNCRQACPVDAISIQSTGISR